MEKPRSVRSSLTCWRSVFAAFGTSIFADQPVMPAELLKRLPQLPFRRCIRHLRQGLGHECLEAVHLIQLRTYNSISPLFVDVAPSWCAGTA